MLPRQASLRQSATKVKWSILAFNSVSKRVNLGSSKTCSSHAVAKAIVDIFNGYGHNCDQTKLIETLVKRFQPGQNCEYVINFRDVPFRFTFWTSSKSYSRTIDLSLKVQLQDKQPIAPHMTSQNLDLYNTRMIVVYEWNPNQTHAVYVKSFEQAKGNPGYIFHCINSWGPKEEYPDIESKNVIKLYYVSLYIDQNSVTHKEREIFSLSFLGNALSLNLETK